LFEIPPESESISHEEEHDIDEETIQLNEFQSNVYEGWDIPIPIMQLLTIEVLTADIISVVGMEPVWLFVPCPLCVVEVLNSSGLVISSMSSGVLIDCLLTRGSIIVYSMLDVVGLPRDRVRKHFIRLEDFLEHFSSFLLVFSLSGIKVGVVLLCEFVICKLNFLG